MMNTTKITAWGALFLLMVAILATGCKTGKGCDCPTFGKNEPPKVNRF